MVQNTKKLSKKYNESLNNKSLELTIETKIKNSLPMSLKN